MQYFQATQKQEDFRPVTTNNYPMTVRKETNFVSLRTISFYEVAYHFDYPIIARYTSDGAMETTVPSSTIVHCDESQDFDLGARECSTEDCATGPPPPSTTMVKPKSESRRRSVSFGELVVTEFPVCLGDSDVVTGTETLMILPFSCLLLNVGSTRQ